MRLASCLIVSSLFVALPLPVLAAASTSTESAAVGIAAVVNDEAVSNLDLEGRVRLAMLGSGIEITPEVVARLRPQILRALLDERLQMQEAKRLNISVPESDIAANLAKLAEQNGMKVEDMPRFFAAKGVPLQSLKDQIAAQLAWTMVVQRKLRSQVNISDQEVDAELQRQMANAGKPEFLAAEIFLPVDKPQNDESVKQAALRLIEQLSRGARFSAIAKEFSQSASAARSGDLGWVLPGQLEPDLDQALQKMSAGTITPPIRTAAGYYILMLREVRQGRGLSAAAAAPTPAAAPVTTTTMQPSTNPLDAVVDLRQVLLPLPVGAQSNDLQTVALQVEGLRARAKSCADMEAMAASTGDTAKGNLGQVRLGDLPPAVQPVLLNLAPNSAGPAMRNDRGILFLMVCSKTMPQVATTAPAAPAPSVAAVGPTAQAAAPVSASEAEREAVLNQLGMQKLELLARRYMRDLRQNAYIDIRG